MFNPRKFLPLIITSAIVIGVWSTALAETKPETVSLSLADAIQCALENNIDLKSNALDLKNAELTLSETEANALLKPSPSSVLQAKTSLNIAQLNYDSAKSDLMINVSDAYFGLIKAQNLVKVYDNALKSSQDNLQTVQAKLKIGVAAPLDEIKAQADVITKEGNLDKSINSLQLSQLKLSQLLRKDPSMGYNLTTHPVYQKDTIDLNADLSKALATRTEVIQALANVDISQSDVDINTNDYTPAVTLDKSKVALEKAKLSVDQTKDKIATEIKQNYINLMDGYNRILSLEKSLAAANETLRVTQIRYKATMAVNSEVIDAQNSVTQTAADLEGAIFDYQIAKYRYLKSVGTEYEPK